MERLILGVLCLFLSNYFVFAQSPIRLFAIDKPQELKWKTLRSKTDVRIFAYDQSTYTSLKTTRPALLNMMMPTLDGNEMELELIENNFYSPGFKLTTEKGVEVPYTPGLFYKGKIKGEESSFVTLSFFDNEVMGIIARKDEGQMVIGKSSALRSNTFMLVDQTDMENPEFTCHTQDLPQWPTQVKVIEDGLRSKSLAKCVDVFFEIGNNVYTFKGSNVQSTADFISGLFNGTSSIYSNESVSTSISQMRVWTAVEPYSGLGFSSSIGSFNGDLAHYVKMASGNGASGVAYLPGLCGANYAYSELFTSGSSYPSYSWNVNVITHEMGHNLGSPHTQSCSWPGGAIDGCYDPEGSCTKGPLPAAGKGTIMSYCHLNSSVGINFANGFGPLPGAKIRDIVNNAGCIADCSGGGPILTGGGSTPLPPASVIDLQVPTTSITPNSITSVTQSFALTVSIKNAGTLNSPASVARVYFSTDNAVSNNDQIVSDLNIPALNANAGANATLNLQLASTAVSGVYYFITCADHNSQVSESIETNNCKSSYITLTLPGTTPPPPPPPPTPPADPVLPDLTLDLTSSIPSLVNPGSQISMAGYTANGGTGIAGQSHMSAVISEDTEVSGDDYLVYINNSIPSITPGGRSNFSGNITIPNGLTGSRYNLIICADVDKSVSESNETNNCKTYSLNLFVARADLAITSLGLTPSVVPVGSPFKVSFDTENKGGTLAPATSTAIFLSNNNTYESNDGLLVTLNATEIAGGRKRSDQITINTKINPGNYFIIVCADRGNFISESDEINNCCVSALTITNPLPDLVIGSFSTPSIVLIGENLYKISLSIKNNGSKKADAVSNGQIKFGVSANDANALQILNFDIPALDINQTFDTSVMFKSTDENIIGDRVFMACIDVTNKVTESNEGNNCQSNGTSIVIPTMDLKNITAVNYTQSIGRGGKITVPFSMANIGTKISDTAVVEYYLSTKALLNQGLGRVALDTIRTKVKPGDTLSKSLELYLPKNISTGSYYFNLCIDYNNKLREVTKINNCQAVRITIRQEMPDLIIKSISVLDTAITFGKPNKLKISISNIGEASAINATTAIWFNAGSAIDSTSISNVFIDTLKANKTLDTIITFIPMLQIADSSLNFGAFADVLNISTESKENNNGYSLKYTITRRLPDIALSQIEVVKNWTSEEDYDIKHNLFNNGLNPSGVFNITYTLKDSNQIAVKSMIVEQVSISPGDSINKSVKFKLPLDVKTGSYSLDVFADILNTVVEINESNNELLAAITVIQKMPDFAIESLFVSDTLQKGSTNTVKIKITNLGTWNTPDRLENLFLSIDNKISADDIKIAQINLHSLSPGQLESMDIQIVIPDDFKTNDYYLILDLDEKNDIIEINELNNKASSKFMVPNKKADLAHIGLVLEEGKMRQGDTMHLMQFIKNVGETTSKDFDISLYIKKNLADDTSVVEFSSMAHGDAVLPTLSSEIFSSLVLPSNIEPGKYYLIACIDPKQLLEESSTKNNCGQLLISIEKKASLTTSVYRKAIFESTILYPNPAVNIINVTGTLKEVSGKIKVDLRDYTGRLVSTNYIQSDRNINYTQNISILHSGWYVIEFSSDKGAWRQSFLKF